MTTPFLILHKVRGAPAFDIAIPTTIADEAAWIIPTSGHRAYPVCQWELSDLASECGEELYRPVWAIEDNRTVLDEVPDHYSCNDTFSIQAESLGTAQALLAKLGLGSKPIKRRRID